MQKIKRLKRHKAFMQRVKNISHKLSNSHTTPFPELIRGLDEAEEDYEKLSDKWQRWVSRRINLAIEKYNKPVVQGSNGQWYSAADMDDAMTSGI